MTNPQATDKQKNYLLKLGMSQGEIDQLDIKSAKEAIQKLLANPKKKEDQGQKQVVDMNTTLAGLLLANDRILSYLEASAKLNDLAVADEYKALIDAYVRMQITKEINKVR